jgi:hypothetical protein
MCARTTFRPRKGLDPKPPVWGIMAGMVLPSRVTLIHTGAGSRDDGHVHAIRGLDLLLEEADPEARDAMPASMAPLRRSSTRLALDERVPEDLESRRHCRRRMGVGCSGGAP